ALEHHVERLADDHANARRLAAGLNQIDGLQVELETVQTNMVMFDIHDTRWDGKSLSGALKEAGVLANATTSRRIRMVTHKDVTEADVPEVLERVARVVKAGPGAAGSGYVYG
ncbi:MAG TPA: low specificity L-threonine aldolase, partial [Symbiobacteriaceae bacterium]|nr:low specificity L-threonine aldolase [Symbiobacteriaceae bacterium]